MSNITNILAKTLKVLGSILTNQELSPQETKHIFPTRFKMAIFQDGQRANLSMGREIQWAAMTFHPITELTIKLVACRNGSKQTMTPTADGLEFAVVGTPPTKIPFSRLLQLAHLETQRMNYVRRKVLEQGSELSVYTPLLQNLKV